MSMTILGLFETSHEAQLAVHALVDAGVSEHDLSLMMPDEAAKTAEASGRVDPDRGSTKRVTAGLGAGAAAGGALGLLAGLGAFVIPGLGPILAAGPIVAALEGAGFGAIAGGIAGTLSDIGVPDSKLDFYGESVRSGAVLVVAHTTEADAPRVHRLMAEHGALETSVRTDEDESISEGASEVSAAERAQADAHERQPHL